jgi:hypothetical protein
MYKNGKKIQTNKKFTYDEMRKVAAETATASQIDIADTFMHIAIMAYIDSGGADTDGFISLLNKYCADYQEGDYSKTDMRKYNSERIKEFFNDNATRNSSTNKI